MKQLLAYLFGVSFIIIIIIFTCSTQSSSSLSSSFVVVVFMNLIFHHHYSFPFLFFISPSYFQQLSSFSVYYIRTIDVQLLDGLPLTLLPAVSQHSADISDYYKCGQPMDDKTYYKRLLLQQNGVGFIVLIQNGFALPNVC